VFGGFEVNFLPELKHLHDAGYNILTYDLRNHGQSGEANGVISGLGFWSAGCRRLSSLCEISKKFGGYDDRFI
jgi:pimeloyl-ACP methyl ester carboxylesterase